MKKSIKLIAERDKGLNEWSNQLKENLNFSKAVVSVPDGKDVDLFKGNISIDELNGGVLKAIVVSTAQRVKLAHADISNQKKNKIFIVTSCNGLLFLGKTNRINISVGDGIIIPSWAPFIEESNSNRKSVSLILDVSSVSDEDNLDELNKILWKKTSELHYGMEINKLMMNYLFCYKDNFCERNTQALLSLLYLELEHSKKASTFQQENKSNQLELVINYIKNNIKNPELSLSTVAKYMGFSKRMVQYVLSETENHFCDLVAKERCSLLASKIRENHHSDVNIDIFDVGFSSIATACRQFQKIYNVTPKQYQMLQKRKSQTISHYE